MARQEDLQVFGPNPTSFFSNHRNVHFHVTTMRSLVALSNQIVIRPLLANSEQVLQNTLPVEYSSVFDQLELRL